MITKKILGIRGLTLCLLLMPFLGFAQEAQYMIVTRVHFNPKSALTVEQWKALEKEYFDKVTSKNDFIVGSNMLVHFYSSDNSEAFAVTTYRSWEDMPKADAKTAELEKAAWPDEAKRKAFFKDRRSCYMAEHSDEIRVILPNTKVFTGTTEHIYYLRTSRMAYPADSKEGELKELMAEYHEHVTLKNTFLKGYYPSRHFYGADSREFIEAFVYTSLSDMEKANEESDKLEAAHWPDEAKRKEYFAKLNKYFQNWHGDALYKHVPELRKVAAPITKK